jgi:hypothetical protein
VRHHGRLIAFLFIVSAAPALTASPQESRPAAEQEPQEQKPEESTPKRRRRLRIDVDKHVEKMLEEHEKMGIPRFEETVEVIGKSPQIMLERFFGGLDLECGPVPGGAPTHAEMRGVRPQPAQFLDLSELTASLARILKTKLRKDDSDRYFVYRVKRGNEVDFAMREGRLPETTFFNSPGTIYELVASFPDRDGAKAAWLRLQRGLPAVRAVADSKPSTWTSATCRPVRR